MPIGGFLDTFSTILFVAFHVVFLAVGVWALWKTQQGGVSYAWAFGLYALTQLFFLGHFSGILTLKMTVFLEQTLMVILVIWIALASIRAKSGRSM
jgi:hypothetical protein